MMRITGGRHRNRTVRIAPGVRPTGGRIREAIFSMWSERVSGARFLDLFAGSGAVGLEALSRGADLAVFVEQPGQRVRTLEENCRRLAAERWTVRAYRIVESSGKPQALEGRSTPLAAALAADLTAGEFDLAFADPPYDYAAWEELLSQVGSVLQITGEAAIEHSSRVALPEWGGRLSRQDCRTYGESAVTLYRCGERLVRPATS